MSKTEILLLAGMFILSVVTTAYFAIRGYMENNLQEKEGWKWRLIGGAIYGVVFGILLFVPQLRIEFFSTLHRLMNIV